MDAFMILLEQIALFAVYLLTGVLLVRTNVLNESGLEPISKFVLKLALSVMIFINTINGVTRREFFETLPVLALTALMYFLLYCLAAVLAKVFRLKGNRRQVFRAVTMFGNIGFMGIPVISSIYPKHGMLYIALFTVVDQLILWTVGVHLTTPEESGKRSFSPRKFVNPATVAVLSAVLLILCGWKLPLLLFLLR